MKKILHNIATLELLRYCKDNKIIPSGTHTVKVGRGFTYALVRSGINKTLVTVTFHKYAVPTFVSNLR